MKKSMRLYLTGTVQGIFFRQFVKENADKNGVKGYVRNLEDGRVEIFLEGDMEKVNAVSLLCKKGPQHARIRNAEEKLESFQGFK
jgi:acylphosphatase